MWPEFAKLGVLFFELFMDSSFLPSISLRLRSGYSGQAPRRSHTEVKHQVWLEFARLDDWFFELLMDSSFLGMTKDKNPLVCHPERSEGSILRLCSNSIWKNQEALSPDRMMDSSRCSEWQKESLLEIFVTSFYRRTGPAKDSYWAQY